MGFLGALKGAIDFVYEFTDQDFREQALGLPGRVETCRDFISTSAALSLLADKVYDVRKDDEGNMLWEHGAKCTLIHVVEPAEGAFDDDAEGDTDTESSDTTDTGDSQDTEDGGDDGVDIPVKFAVWLVEGVDGADPYARSTRPYVVVAFRGTDNFKDILRDIDIAPTALADTGHGAGIYVHRGFKDGATKHASLIARLVRSMRSKHQAGAHMPLVLTGHSLGGGYAATLLLHMLAHREQYDDLVAQGAKAVTFGSPFVLHSEDLDQLEESMASLLSTHPRFEWINIVNGIDFVPRLLGSCMNSARDMLEELVPSTRLEGLLQAVRAVTHNYQPLGTYHLILAGRLRTVDSRDKRDILRALKLRNALKANLAREEHAREAGNYLAFFEAHKMTNYYTLLSSIAEQLDE